MSQSQLKRELRWRKLELEAELDELLLPDEQLIRNYKYVSSLENELDEIDEQLLTLKGVY